MKTATQILFLVLITGLLPASAAQARIFLDGTIEIDTPNLNLNEGFLALPEYRPITEVTQDDCDVRSRDTSSSLLVIGNGGLPPQP